MLLGCRPGTVRLLRGNRAEHIAGRCVSGVRTPCGIRVDISPDIRRTPCGHYATYRLIFDKGMVSNQNTGFQIRESRQTFRSAERDGWLRECVASNRDLRHP